MRLEISENPARFKHVAALYVGHAGAYVVENIGSPYLGILILFTVKILEYSRLKFRPLFQ